MFIKKRFVDLLLLCLVYLRMYSCAVHGWGHGWGHHGWGQGWAHHGRGCGHGGSWLSSDQVIDATTNEIAKKSGYLPDKKKKKSKK